MRIEAQDVSPQHRNTANPMVQRLIVSTRPSTKLRQCVAATSSHSQHTSSSLNVTRSTDVPLREKGSGGSLKMEPNSIYFVFWPFTFTSAACCTSSSMNICMKLTADLSNIAVIVVSSTNLWIRHPACSESIKMTNVNGPR